MMRSTLITINGKGTIYIPKGNDCSGIKWYKDRIRPRVSGYEIAYYGNKLQIIEQPLWDAIVDKYAKNNCLKDLNLSNCYFHNVKFHNLCFDDVDFSNSYFSTCSFAELVFKNCSFKKATVYDILSNCDFTHCNFNESGLYQATLNDCHMVECDFSHATMRHVIFSRCLLKENELYGVLMDTVYFNHSHCLLNKSISHIQVTMGGARYDEVDIHKISIMNALTA